MKLPIASLIILLFFLTPIVRAGISAPNSSVRLSADDSRILVMRSPFPAEDSTPFATLPGGRIVNVHNDFPSSGVYETATLRPLWHYDWFALECDLNYADDFRYLVRCNRRAFHGVAGTWAIAFYGQDKLTRTYDCNDLLTALRHPRLLPVSTWDFHTRWYDHWDLNPAHTQLRLSTVQRQTYVAGYKINFGLQEFYTFDLATGNLLTRRVTGAWIPWAYLAGALIFLALLAVSFVYTARLLRWLLRRRAPRHGFPVG